MTASEPTTTVGRRFVDPEQQPEWLRDGIAYALDPDAFTRTILAIEAEARQQNASALREALLLAAEEVDNSWYDDEGTVRWHPELWDRLIALRRAHTDFEAVELARLERPR